jgi:hypothetical protein
VIAEGVRSADGVVQGEGEKGDVSRAREVEKTGEFPYGGVVPYVADVVDEEGAVEDV